MPRRRFAEFGTGLGRTLREWASDPEVLCVNADLKHVGVVGARGDGVSYSGSQRAGTQKGILGLSMNILSDSSDQMIAKRFPLVVRKTQTCVRAAKVTTLSKPFSP